MVKNICAIFLVIMAMGFSVTFASIPLELDPLNNDTKAAPTAEEALEPVFGAIKDLPIEEGINDSKALPTEERMIDAAVFDNSRTLSKNEIQSLNNKIKTVEQKHNIKIGIEFLKSIGNANISNAAQELLRKHYSGGQNGGIIFLVVMDSRSWYVATDSIMDNFVNESEIGNALLPSLKDGDYFGACESYIDAVDRFLTYYNTSGTDYEPSGVNYEQNGDDYDDDSSSLFNPILAMIAVVCGIFFGVVVRSFLISSMSNVHHESRATDYLKRETVQFTKNKDTYLFTNVERKPKPSSSVNHSGGGGGGRGGSSGGGAGGSF